MVHGGQTIHIHSTNIHCVVYGEGGALDFTRMSVAHM